MGRMRAASQQGSRLHVRLGRAVRRFLGGLAACVVSLAVAAPQAVPIGVPIPASGTPMAPRGGVLAIPLDLPSLGHGLPAAVPIQIGEGETAIEAEGRVGWLVELGPSLVRRWTAAANPLRVMEVAEGIDPRTVLDPTAEPPRERIVGALLLAEVPPVAGNPAVTVAGRRVEPRWFDPAPPLPPFGEVQTGFADDRPDPDAPSEWFRHAIRSDVGGEPPPAPPGDATSGLFARHVADLWRGGLARVDRHGPSFAHEVRERLVSVATEVVPETRAVPPEDRSRIAAWMAAPDELSALLALLHDAERSDAAVATATGAWLDVNAPLAAWLEGDSGGTVRVGFLNGGSVDRTLVCSWIGADDLPVAAYLPARSVRTVTFDRPAGPPRRARATGDGAEPLVLWARGDGFEKRLTVPFAATPARPPTLNLGSFAAPFTLAEAKRGSAASVSPRFATSATVRRRGTRWEALVECRRDPRIPADDRVVLTWRDDRVEVRPDGATRHSGPGVAPEVSVAAGPELWRARFAFPAEWIPEASPDGVVVALSLARFAGEAQRSAIVPRPAFRRDPAPVEIDLAAWEGR
jgi:hypothetical protein